MGNTNASYTKDAEQAQQQQLLVSAQKNYNARVRNYSYPHHGDYQRYIYECQAQYELECIPVHCRSGGGGRDNIWG